MHHQKKKKAFKKTTNYIDGKGAGTFSHPITTTWDSRPIGAEKMTHISHIILNIHQHVKGKQIKQRKQYVPSGLFYLVYVKSRK